MRNMNSSSFHSAKFPVRFLVTLVISCVVMNLPVLGWGSPPPGRWEKASMTRPGDKITVYLQGGDKQTLTFASVDDECLNCTNQYDGEIQFERAMVEKILVHKAGKYARNGMLLGAVGGAAIGGAWGAVNLYDWVPSGKVVWALACGALGALGGGLTGAVVGSPGETVYISKERALADAK